MIIETDIFNAVSDSIIVTDLRGRVQSLNSTARQLTGLTGTLVGDIQLNSLLSFTVEANGDSDIDPIADTVGGNINMHYPAPMRLGLCGKGKQYSVAVHTVLMGDSGEPKKHIAVIIEDQTELTGLQRLGNFQATHDRLTGLINRREFERCMRAKLVRSRSSGERYALCYLDLDPFRMINDYCGYPAGDALLREIAKRLRQSVRDSDTVARLEGGQFAVILGDCSSANCLSIADTLRSDVLRTQFPWEEHLFEVSASIGVVALNADSGGATELMSAAAHACHLARQEGRNRVHLHTSSDLLKGDQDELLHWMQRVQHAVEKNCFQLMLQPIVPIAPGSTLKPQGELLVRMVDEKGGLVAPHTFISAAEHFNLMPSIDRWVVRRALELLKMAPQTFANVDRCAINLSGQSLSNVDFQADVLRELQQAGIAGERLCFEITETAAIDNLEAARNFISALKELGCEFALDDFGTGLSSFAYLKNLAVDQLKIDGGFVRCMADDTSDLAMVESINQIGHLFGLSTVAECVEDSHTLALLAKIGVDFAQGDAVAEACLIG